MRSPKPDQPCRLCGNVGPLCRSHIVPDFLCDPLRDSNRQMVVIGPKIRKIQTGYFERLLCSKCESLLSGYENKFKRAWMDTIPQTLGRLCTVPPNNHICVSIPDFTAFKLFHLSVLWRAAASSRFKLESGITLGPYGAQIASMLLNGDPGQPGEFPFFAILTVDDDNHPLATVTQLAEGDRKLNGRHHHYMMTYAYCDWLFVVARPGPACMVNFESECRKQAMFQMRVVPYCQSKSFALWTENLRTTSPEWFRGKQHAAP